jgi:hypothetical protein
VLLIGFFVVMGSVLMGCSQTNQEDEVPAGLSSELIATEKTKGPPTFPMWLINGYWPKR